MNSHSSNSVKDTSTTASTRFLQSCGSSAAAAATPLLSHPGDVELPATPNEECQQLLLSATAASTPTSSNTTGVRTCFICLEGGIVAEDTTVRSSSVRVIPTEVSSKMPPSIQEVKTTEEKRGDRKLVPCCTQCYIVVHRRCWVGKSFVGGRSHVTGTKTSFYGMRIVHDVVKRFFQEALETESKAIDAASKITCAKSAECFTMFGLYTGSAGLDEENDSGTSNPFLPSNPADICARERLHNELLQVIGRMLTDPDDDDEDEPPCCNVIVALCNFSLLVILLIIDAVLIWRFGFYSGDVIMWSLLATYLLSVAEFLVLAIFQRREALGLLIDRPSNLFSVSPDFSPSDSEQVNIDNQLSIPLLHEEISKCHHPLDMPQMLPRLSPAIIDFLLPSLLGVACFLAGLVIYEQTSLAVGLGFQFATPLLGSLVTICWWIFFCVILVLVLLSIAYWRLGVPGFTLLCMELLEDRFQQLFKTVVFILTKMQGEQQEESLTPVKPIAQASKQQPARQHSNVFQKAKRVLPSYSSITPGNVTAQYIHDDDSASIDEFDDDDVEVLRWRARSEKPVHSLSAAAFASSDFSSGTVGGTTHLSPPSCLLPINLTELFDTANTVGQYFPGNSHLSISSPPLMPVPLKDCNSTATAPRDVSKYFGELYDDGTSSFLPPPPQRQLFLPSSLSYVETAPNPAQSWNRTPAREPECWSGANGVDKEVCRDQQQQFQARYSLFPWRDHDSHEEQWMADRMATPSRLPTKSAPALPLDDFSKRHESVNDPSRHGIFHHGSIREKLKLNELYVFLVPVSELIKFFGTPNNMQLLGMFYDRLLSNVEKLPPSVAADLLRLPVRTQNMNLKVIRALCDRLLQFPPETRNLSSMQLALASWSFAKAQVPCNGEKPRNGSGGCYSTELMDSIANEALLKIREFQPLSIANLMWACGKMRYKNPNLLMQLAGAGVVQLNHFNAQNIANTYWSLGALEFDKTSLTPRLGTDAEVEISAILTTKFSLFNPQALANFVWACAKLQWNIPHLVMAAAREATHRVAEFKPQEIANLMWGVAKLGLTEARTIVQRLAHHAASVLHTFNSQEVANVYWAVGTLEIRATALTPAELNINVATSSISTAASEQMLPSNFSSDSLWNGSGAPAAVNSTALHVADGRGWEESSSTRDPSTMETLEKNEGGGCIRRYDAGSGGVQKRDYSQHKLLVTVLNKMAYFNAQAVANFFWACAKLQWKCPEICEATHEVVKKNIRYFRPQNTANFLWAMAKLKFRKDELVGLLTEQALHNFKDFNTQEIANLYWALGTLELKNTSLTPNLSGASYWDITHISERRRDAFPTGTLDGVAVCDFLWTKLKDFKPQEIANFLWACARLKWNNSPIIEEAVARALHLLGRFKPQEIGNLVWSLAKLNYRHVGLLKAMCDDVAPNINKFTSQNVANIYWALGSLGFTQSALSPENPSESFVSSLVKLICQFNNQEVVNFIWACGKLRWTHKTVIESAITVAYARIPGFRNNDMVNLQSALK